MDMKNDKVHRSRVVALAFFVASCGLADAATIGAIFDSTITSSPNAAAIEGTINSVVASYETLLLNPVNITVTFSSMTSGLGMSSSAQTTTTYTNFLTHLTASQTSAADATALASLPVQTNNPVNGTPNIALAQANAQALGIFTGSSGTSAAISLNLSTISAGNYDLSAVVSHELDEVLGIGGAGSGLTASTIGTPGVMDLFRYSAPGVRSYTNSTSATSYFSITGGVTNLVNFNQNAAGDYGDWGNPAGTQTGNSPAQVQDAFGTPGAVVKLGTNEKTALDVAGYTLLTTNNWNPTGSTSGATPDGNGNWTTASGSNWWNGTSNLMWSNGTVQNAQFGTTGTATNTPYTVTLGSAITAGTITFANQNYTINGGGNSLTINNGILAVANATINAPVILGGANSWEVGYTSGTTTATLNVSGNVSGGFGITKQGAGTLVLSGSNSYTGGTTVAAGTLQLNSAGALPASGNVIVSGGTLDVHGQTPSIGNLTFGDGVSATAASLTDSGGTAGNVTLGGDITYAGTFNGVYAYFPAATIAANVVLASGNHNLTTADAAPSANYDLVVTGAFSGPGGLIKNGVNNVALTGANTYGGATVINTGFLFAAATNTLSPNSAITINSPGVLNLNPTSGQAGVFPGSYNQTVGSLAGNGQVTLGSATLTIGSDGTSTNYSGSIVDFGAGGSVTKTGGGTLTISGANNYSGVTTINAGAMQLTNGGSIDASSGVTGQTGGTLVFNYSTNPGFSVPIGGPIGVTQAGTGVLFLLGNNTYTGTTTISSGTVYVGFNGTTGTLGTGSVINNGALWFLHTDMLVVSSPISGSGSLNQYGSGGVIFTGSNTYTGPTTINSGTLQLGNGGTSGSLVSTSTIYGYSGTTLAFNRTDNFTVGNAISGGLNVVQNGTGTVTLSASSGYSGPTTVNSGTLLVSGSISASTATVNSTGTLAGTGAVGPVNILSGGTVLPGSSAGSGLLQTGNFSLPSGAHLSLELGGTTGTGTAATLYSELKVTGSVTLGGDVKISLFNSYTPRVNDTFYVILNDASDAVSGTFSNAVGGIITSGGVQFQVNYAANGDGFSNDVALTVVAVPEPGIWTLLSASAASLVAFRRRQRRLVRG